MNDKKIDVIIHATNEQALAELKNSINQIRKPGGFSVDVKATLRGGVSITPTTRQ